jgi:hypothetical protein
MMCQSWIRSTILENVSPSHGMITHHLETTFGNENLESRVFSLSYFAVKGIYVIMLFNLKINITLMYEEP